MAAFLGFGDGARTLTSSAFWTANGTIDTKSKHGKKRCNSEYLLAVSFPKPHLQVREKLVQRFLQLILNHY